jgi:hypothetical protein
MLGADAIREAEPAPVEDDHAREARERVQEARQRGELPVEIEVRDPAGDPDEVRPLAENLVRDVDVAGSGVMRLGRCGHIPIA